MAVFQDHWPGMENGVILNLMVLVLMTLSTNNTYASNGTLRYEMRLDQLRLVELFKKHSQLVVMTSLQHFYFEGACVVFVAFFMVLSGKWEIEH